MGNIKQEYKLTPQEAFDINQYFSTQKIIHQMEDDIYDIDSREFIDSKLKRNDFTKEEKQQIQYPQNNNYIDNSYAQQMASDISSYRYGKKMTGFIN